MYKITSGRLNLSAKTDFEDFSCAGQNLIGRKRELTTTGVKPWMHRKHLLGRGKSEINSFDLAMFNLLISC
jgi:hypothetical protein